MNKKKIIIISCCIVFVVALALILTIHNKQTNKMSPEEFEQKSTEYTYSVENEFINNYWPSSETGTTLLQYSSFIVEPIDNTKCIAKITAVDMRRVLEKVKAEFGDREYNPENHEKNVYDITQMIRNTIIYDKDLKNYEVELEIADGVPVMNDDFVNCMYGEIFTLYNEELLAHLNELLSEEAE